MVQIYENNQTMQLVEQLIHDTDCNIFLTGKAGTGKSTFLKKIVDTCPKNKVVLAPTGVAAINANGSTIHSFFNLPFTPFVPNKIDSYNESTNQLELLQKLKYNSEKRKIIHELDLLIIDEISMVRADILDSIDCILKHFRNQKHKPFGGVQVLFVGDLFQLSPIAKNEEWSILKRFYKSLYFFDSQVVSSCELLKIEFTHIYRQQDDFFIEVLNKIRNNQINDEIRTLFNDMSIYTDQIDFQKSLSITLTTHRQSADHINQKELDKINSKSVSYKGILEGEFKENAVPVDIHLMLKEGAQVMFVKNDIGTSKKYYNGKLGTIVKLNEDEIIVSSDGQEIEVKQEIWKQIEYRFNNDTNKVEENEIGRYIQYPLKLAWAITIHKSQGLTFDSVILDIQDVFASGQAYVALSRCRSLAGIQLLRKFPLKSIAYEDSLLAFDQKKMGQKEIEQVYEIERVVFQQKQLSKAFDFTLLHLTIHEISDAFIVHLSKIKNQTEVSELIQLIERHTTEIIQVASKFQHQLHQFYLTTPPQMRDQSIQDRLEKATTYFSKYIINELLINYIELEQKISYFSKITEFKNLVKLGIDSIFGFYNNILHTVQKYSVSNNYIDQYVKEIDELKMQRLKNLQTPADKKSKLPTTEVTFQLLQEGFHYSEIAQKRNVTEATILSHLLTLYMDKKLDIESIFDEETIIECHQFVDSLPKEANFQYIKDLNFKHSYAILKFFLKKS